MKKILYILPIISLSFFLALAPGKAFAAFDAGYIMSDGLFSDYNSMNEAQIQAFLETRTSFLATYADTIPSEVSVDGVLIPAHTPASRMIYIAAQRYHINPQVIIVTIQKEQSSIGTTLAQLNPVPGGVYMKIDCAMGYDYGLGCPDTFATHPGLRGFAQQVTYGTWQLKHDFECAVPGTVSWDGFNCGGNRVGSIISGVTIQTRAAAALYNYTPNIATYGPGYSFRINFINWFGNVLDIEYSNPSQYLKDNFSISAYSISNGMPVVGEAVTGSYSLTNNLSTDFTLDAVGFVARVGSANSAVNRDYPWQQAVHFNPGQTLQFVFTTTVKDVGSIYVWPAIYSQGTYAHYYQGWTITKTRLPNLSISTNLAGSSGLLYAGQDIPISVSVKNNENIQINYDALGIPARLNSANVDVVWSVNSHFDSNETKPITGTLKALKAGTYILWVGIQQGDYRLLKAADGMQYLVLNVINPPYADLSLADYKISSNVTPALGDTVTADFSLTNNLSVPITIDAVGFVAKSGSLDTGISRDYGWYAPVLFAPHQKLTFHYSTTVKDKGSLYIWPAFYYQGYFVHYLRGWTVLNVQ